MTDVIDRATSAEEVPAVSGEAGAEEASSTAVPVPTEPARRLDLPAPDRWALGALLAAAGVIHLVMAPSHLGESALEGAGFVVAGWVQVGVGLAVLLRPTRWILQLAAVSSLVLIAAWAVSRTVGLPFGPHARHAESVSIVDGTVVAFELGALALAGFLLLRGPGVFRFSGGIFALVVPVAAFALATAAIASPQARDHAAGSHGQHDEDMAGGAGHDHGTAGADDKGLSLLDNGHQHESGVVDVDAATQAELAVQLAGTSQLVERYPTVADAEAAGYRRAGPFAPGLGTHYSPPGYNLNGDGVIDPEDIDDPMLIFDGNEPDSPLSGFMYLVISEEEPEGFVGPNDHWHYHTNVCIVVQPNGQIDTPLGADMEGITEEMCADVGGRLQDITSWMVHVWTVPGYQSERGLFSEINPAITCPDGTYYMIPIEELGFKDTTCRNS